ncbi:MAG: hypothetical protein LBM61_05180 [Prevotellaceae bacterium]|nr:hypothetical protein [Prevotellaceae bacterium]
MIGNGILGFAVIAVVVLFVLISMQMNSKLSGTTQYHETYTFTLSDGFAGDSIAVYLNDSLLLDARIATTPRSIETHRLGEDNTILIVDQHTDLISPFDLSPRGGSYIFTRDVNGIKIKEQ